MKPIAILGTGNVGQALASAFRRLGQPYVFGARTPKGADQLGLSEAVAAADLVILAVPYAAALDLAAALPDWGNRILVDATNPIAPDFSGLALGTTTSGAEQVAARARNARVVKAFNTTGAENMADSAYAAPLMMPVAGDDPEARAAVMALARGLGFEAVDAGDLTAARLLEPFAMTWIHLAIKRGLGRRIAFVLLRR